MICCGQQLDRFLRGKICLFALFLTYSFVSNSGAVLAEHELLGCSGECRETGDGEVLVVQVGVVADDLVSL